MANRTDQATKIVGEYIGKKVVADLDGTLFGSVADTFAFRFVAPKELQSEIVEGYEDYLEDWNFKETVPVAAVSSAKSTDYEFAWIFLDWSEGEEAPRVLATTTDRW